MVKYGSSSISKKKQIGSMHSVLNPYEKVRSSIMEKNAQKFKELGLEQIAQQLMDSLTARTKGKQNDNNVDNDNQDYQPADLNDQDYQPVDDDDHDSDEENSNVLKKEAPASSSRSLPNKVL